jgi:cytochrome c-type biogenesis protein CcmH/NrfF
VTRALALAIALLLVAAPAAFATCPRTSVADLEDEVMCPVCGESLALAREAPLAQRERALIQRLVARCESKGQIKDELVAQFGPSVLALPQDHGFDATAYLVPAGGGVVALAATALLLRRWRRRPAAAPAPPVRASAADHRRLEAELDRLR